MNLEQISSITKIAKKYLLALEAEDFEVLPARVFVQGYVKQYAKILGLDGAQVVHSYMKKYSRG